MIFCWSIIIHFLFNLILYLLILLSLLHCLHSLRNLVIHDCLDDLDKLIILKIQCIVSLFFEIIAYFVSIPHISLDRRNYFWYFKFFLIFVLDLFFFRLLFFISTLRNRPFGTSCFSCFLIHHRLFIFLFNGFINLLDSRFIIIRIWR
jgi:hypothetical protein